MADTKISALTAATSLNNTDEFALNQSGTSKKATTDLIDQYGYALVVLDAAYTLTSTTSAQKLFNASTNGALTLSTGWYRFTCGLGISSMSATSGNGQFQLLGAGTATLGGVLYTVTGGDVAATTTVAGGASWATGSNSSASMVTAATGTGLGVVINGTFEVTASGTIIPSIALVTAAAASVNVGSFFECKRWGALNANVLIGSWS